MTTFPPIAHVAITVNDLDLSVSWYHKLLESEPVLNEDTGPFHHVVFMLGNTLLGLHKFPGRPSAERFSEFRPGLDHIGFGCANRAELEQWKKRLDGLGIENGGIVDAPYGSGLSFRDPDNIALEFFAPPG